MQPACHTSFLSTVCTVYASKPNKDLVNTGILRQPQLDPIQSNNIVSLLEYLPGTSMVGSPRPGGEKINIWGLSDPEDVPVTVDALIKYAHASNNIQNNWSGALFAQSDNRMFDILTYYTKGN